MTQKWAIPGLFFYNFNNKCMWKNVHPIYGAGICTHNHQYMSLLPLQLDQSSRFAAFNISREKEKVLEIWRRFERWQTSVTSDVSIGVVWMNDAKEVCDFESI